ncbi:hypothetical protein DH2020_031759 [Rehmannia glutinosa]|uniref:tRNA (guanine(37)-N1)-methyltransferase n=1 Tax=Rehmannia glutinosa TaxID=99300 RepID=A0ABR0VH72_REHGL
MAAKFSLFRPLTLPVFTFYSPPRTAAKRIFSPLLSYATTTALSFSTLPYGPSLQKGHSPFPLELLKYQTGENVESLDEAAFTRVFDISALRVPSEICATLENRLRGHLLNWPRVKNIARVPGDEIDDQLKTILPSSDHGAGAEAETEELVALNRRIYGKAEGDGEPLNEVLYRDKLARTFNSRGYAKFRNLAKISRPKMKKKRDGGEKRGVKGVGRNDVALVEVIENEEESDGEDFSRLLGEEFGRWPKWRGSTRLLLLDEQYANKKIEELPEAIKVVFQEHGDECRRSAFELVKCKLTLFYDYWQLNEVLEALLPKDMITPSAFETVGHIAHLNLRDEHLQYKKLIAKVVLDKNRPKIQTVVNKVDAIHNDFRIMQLEVLAEIIPLYWNSRLATERQRLLSCFTHRDVVSKKVKYVYANDLNPCAVEYLERNCVLNKLERKIEVYNMDGRRFIETVFASQRTRSITQVVMNLPKDAAEFLDAFRGVFQGHGPNKEYTMPRIHVYGFSKAEDPEFEFHEGLHAFVEIQGNESIKKDKMIMSLTVNGENLWNRASTFRWGPGDLRWSPYSYCAGSRSVGWRSRESFTRCTDRRRLRKSDVEDGGWVCSGTWEGKSDGTC